MKEATKERIFRCGCLMIMAFTILYNEPPRLSNIIQSLVLSIVMPILMEIAVEIRRALMKKIK